jgi:hypothetical protein
MQIYIMAQTNLSMKCKVTVWWYAHIGNVGLYQIYMSSMLHVRGNMWLG